MEPLSTKIDQLSAKIDQLSAKIDQLTQPNNQEANATEQHRITHIEKYISRSGNPTWRAHTTDHRIIYLRQAHRAMLEDAGLWPALDAMQFGDERDAALEIDTVPDGDFLKPVRVSGRILPRRVTPALRELAAAVESTNFVVLDTETTGLDGVVVQIAVIDPQGGVLLDMVIRPTRPVENAARAVHGLSEAILADAPTLSEVSAELAAILRGTNVVGWNVQFDRGALIRSAQDSGLTGLLACLESETTWLDAMRPYSANVAREWNAARNDYTWQKLTAAARHYQIETTGAHSALADAKMTLAVVRAMIDDQTAGGTE